MAQQNNEEREVIEIDLDEYNEMRKELKELREKKEEPREVVKIRLDEYNALLAEKKALEEKIGEVPKFDTVPTNAYMGLSVPYQQPVQKKNGWETFGKIALGGALATLVVVGVNALTGGSTGIDNNNTFGGNMP